MKTDLTLLPASSIIKAFQSRAGKMVNIQNAKKSKLTTRASFCSPICLAYSPNQFYTGSIDKPMRKSFDSSVEQQQFSIVDVESAENNLQQFRQNSKMEDIQNYQKWKENNNNVKRNREIGLKQQHKIEQLQFSLALNQLKQQRVTKYKEQVDEILSKNLRIKNDFILLLYSILINLTNLEFTYKIYHFTKWLTSAARMVNVLRSRLKAKMVRINAVKVKSAARNAP